MDTNTLKDQTAVCGIDCFNCEFFHTNIDGFFTALPPARKAAFDARGMSKEKLRCQGCRHGGCTVIGGRCETFECARAKGVDFCHECSEFPCQRLQPLAEGADKYPHNLKVYNLMSIKTRGIEAWAAEVGEIRRRYFRGKFKIGAGPQS
jgi:hypothetical protein